MYEILDDAFTIGSGEQADLRLREDGLAPLHIEMTRRPKGYRARAKGTRTFRLGDQEVAQAELRDGDVLRIGDLVLVYHDESAPRELSTADRFAAAAVDLGIANEWKRRDAARVRGDAMRDRATKRGRTGAKPPGGMPRAVWASTLVAVAAVLLILVVELLSSVDATRSPADLVGLAETQLAQGQSARALDTLEIAGRNASDPALKARILDLRTRIETSLRRQADQDAIDRARVALQALLDFERVVVRREPTRRAVAREFVRNADAFLAAYGEVLGRHDDLRGEPGRVKELRDRHAPAAELDRPDDADDVLFAVDRMLRPTARPYRSAVARLDAYLATAPEGPETTRVRQHRDRLVTEGRTWFDGRIAEIDRLRKLGQFDEARRLLDQLKERSALDDWRPSLDAVASRVEAAESEWRQKAGK